MQKLSANGWNISISIFWEDSTFAYNGTIFFSANEFIFPSPFKKTTYFVKEIGSYLRTAEMSLTKTRVYVKVGGH